MVRAWRAVGLDVAECCKRAASVTNEFVYTHGDVGEFLDRFAPRLMSDRALPVKHRILSEVINPQPEAMMVIRKLLNWIGAVDSASQRAGVRPAFKTTDDQDIFPGEDKPWWLTDVQQRKKPEETRPADEDGPVSECDDPKDETEDEDPTSEEEFNETSIPAPGYNEGRPFWAEACERPSLV